MAGAVEVRGAVHGVAPLRMDDVDVTQVRLDVLGERGGG